MSRRDYAVSWCATHGKLSYKSRKDARQIGKRHHPIKSPFPCDPDAIFPVWHIGSLPTVVKKGIVGREGIYRREAA